MMRANSVLTSSDTVIYKQGGKLYMEEDPGGFQGNIDID